MTGRGHTPRKGGAPSRGPAEGPAEGSADGVVGVVAALRGEGALAAEGGFTIDGAKAREKMQAYQLASPHEYVLLLVRAATLRGAASIDFTIDSDDVRMSFDAHFSATELEGIDSAIFGDGDDRASRARQALALGLSAALATGPAFVRIESSDGATGARVELRPEALGAAPGVITAEPALPAGTRIWVRDRFGVKVLLKFVRQIGGEAAEALALRERVRWASAAISLNGARISAGLGGLTLLAEGALAGDGFYGVVGFDPREYQAPARIDLLCNGVWICQKKLSFGPSGLRAWVDGSALMTDLSQQAIVEDEAYQAALAAVRQAARRAIGELAALAGAQVDPPRWMIEELQRWLFKKSRTELEGWGRRADLMAIYELPLWRSTRGERRSTRALVESKGAVAFSQERYGGLLPPGFDSVIHAPDAAAAAFLRRALGERAQDVGEALAAAAESAAALERFLARQHSGRLGVGVSSAGPVPIVGEGLAGELAIRAFSSERAELTLVHQGAHLCTLRAELPVPGVVAVVAAALEPTPSFDGVVPEIGLARALIAALAALEAAITELAAKRLRLEVVTAYVQWALDPGHVEGLLGPAGFSRRGWQRLLSGTAWFEEYRRGASRWLEDPARAPLTEVALVRVGRGERWSLRQLEALRGRRGGLPWVAAAGPLLRAPPDVIALEAEDQALVTLAFGRAALIDGQAEVAAMAAEEALARLPVESVREEGAAAEASWTCEGLELWIGAVAAPYGPETIAARVLRRRRLVGTVRVEVPLGGVRATASGEGLAASGPNAAESERIRREVVEKGLPALISAACAKLAGTELGRRERRATAVEVVVLSRLLLGAWALSSAGGGLIWALQRAQAAWRLRGEVGEALVGWPALAAAAGLVGPEAVEAALARLRAREPEAGAAAIAGAITGAGAFGGEGAEGGTEGGGRRRGRRAARGRAESGASAASAAASAGLRRGTLTALPHLLGLPLLRRLGGGRVSVEALLAAGEGSIGVVDERLAERPCFDQTIAVVSTEERAALLRCVGAARVIDRGEWLEEKILGQRLASLPKVGSLRVAPELVVAAVAVSGEFSGEIGLARAGEGAVAVCVQGRLLTRVALDAEVPIVGVLDAGSLELDGATLLPNEAGLARLRAVVMAHREAALAAGLAAWAGRSEVEVEAALRWLLPLLERLVPKVGEQPRRLTTLRPQALAEAAIFPLAAGGRASLAALVAACQRSGGLCFLGSRDAARRLLATETAAVGSETPVLLLPDAAAVRAATGLFSPKNALQDYAEVAARAETIRQRQAAAPKLLAAPPRRALVSLAIAGAGLRGWIWLEGQVSEEGITFGREGKALGVLRPPGAEGIVGAIEGEGVEIFGAWEGARIGKAQQTELSRAVGELWKAAVDRYNEGLRAGEALAGALVGRLRARLLEMHGAIEGERRAQRRARREKAALYVALRSTPLLELPGGRRISLETALREQPSELAGLLLWPAAKARRGGGGAAGSVVAQAAGERPGVRGEQAADGAALAPKAAGRTGEPLTLRDIMLAKSREREAARQEGEGGRDAAQDPVSGAVGRRGRGRPNARSRGSGAAPENAGSGRPQPGPPKEELLLIEALRAELRMLRDRENVPLTGFDLQQIRVAEVDQGGVADLRTGQLLLAREHPVIRALLGARSGDPLLVSMVASAAYSAINRAYEAVSDSHEAAFHAAHALYVMSAGVGDGQG
ncbi:MAG: hypothetical protein IPK80_26930 [Nannocystis sp.]|nr:hypothetical protein [Nannocystis sp.]